MAASDWVKRMGSFFGFNRPRNGPLTADALTREWNPEAAALRDAIAEAGQRHGYLPTHEFPHIPELILQQQALVFRACQNINDRMKTVGLDAPELLAVFRSVFQRTCELVYEWHLSSDGEIQEPFVDFDPLAEEQYGGLPPEMRDRLWSCGAPEMACSIFVSWWPEHEADVRKQPGEIWHPLSGALLMTSALAVSVALKAFGYRK